MRYLFFQKSIAFWGSWIFYVVGDVIGFLGGYFEEHDMFDFVHTYLFDFHRKLMYKSRQLQKLSETDNGPWEKLEL